MKKLSKFQLQRMDEWMQHHSRPYDRAKWNFLFHNGTKDAIVEEMLKYQNSDGGMGHGFEADVLCPLSAAIPTAEAIFQSYDYQLDCTSDWFGTILTYFERSVQNIPKYWEDTPKEAMNYPHAPWWNWAPCTVFNPNPCAVVASAFLRYGTESQRALGEKIAVDCLALLVSHDFCGDHDTLCMQALVEQLSAIHSPLITDEVLAALRRRILENTCFDVSKYRQYYFTPLDFVSSPRSMWYGVVEHGIEPTLAFWLETLNEHGVWTPNFSWGVDSEASRQVTKAWTGYLAVKRAKILLAFDRIEI